MSYFKLSNGESIFYEDIGSGENTLVMVSGWSVDHTYFVKPANALKEIARCVYYDHRGHGLSKDANKDDVSVETLAADLKELFDGLHLENVTLLGWSMGVSVVLTFIKMFGCESLKQVILCDMTPKCLNDDEWHMGIHNGTYRIEDMEAEKGLPFFDLYKKFVVEAVPRLKKVPNFLLNIALRKLLKKSDEKVLRSLSFSMKMQDNRDIVPTITVPITYLYPYPGSSFNPDLAEWYRAHAKTTYRSIRFDNADHMFVSQYSKEFTETLRQILQSDITSR